jgi:light-regulated signal transduction histidine kinase (bacteriophytochrome)/CheY-like chemotaxis protein
MLACDASADRILRCSENAGSFLSPQSRNPIGQRLGEYFSADVAHDFRNAMAQSAEPRRPGLLLGYPLARGGRLFDIAAHRHEDCAIIELEYAAEQRKSPLELARALIGRTQSLTTIEQLARQTPRYLQTMLGYDRVMIYRFSDDGSGKVIGEAKRPHLESFLGQHFPGADIPQQARALYLKNMIRVIADASGPRSLITPEFDESGAPLDLSFAHLRSVSPIHLEYLRNMGVAASMSLSIVVDGKLWGLIACHHYQPKALSMPLRIVAEMFGDFFSLHLTASHHHARYDASVRARKALDAMMSELTFHDGVETYLREHLPDLRRLVPCDGAGLWMNGVWVTDGSAPPDSAVPELVESVKAEKTSEGFATHCLSDRLPAAVAYAHAASGVLAVPLSKLPRDFLFFFRKEQVHTLAWAGDPNKSYDSGPLGDRLTPRTSFAIWKQLVERQSTPWSEEDRHTAEAARVGLQEIILRQNEIMEGERKEAAVRQRILNEELNHRVKNILALIKSLVSQQPESAQNLAQYVETLKGRIMALAFAHDQVVRSDGGGSLRQLFEAELSPYPATQVALVGDDVGLDARAISVMALVIHELATNAAKYGALSAPSGRVRVNWGLDESGACEVAWRENGGPRVVSPSHSGFGSVLLNRSIPFDLNGESRIDYAPAGVTAHFSVPAAHILKAVPRDPRSAPARSAASGGGEIKGKRFLLIEDQLVIALEAEEILRGAGAATVETAATVRDALNLLLSYFPDLAILDVNLGEDTSVEVAEELRRRAIPFIFATGYGDSSFIPKHMRHVPVVRKPYSADALTKALASVVAADPAPV